MEMKIDREALFTDETSLFRYPTEVKAGDVVTFRFRVKKDNADGVFLCGRTKRQRMEKVKTIGRFDYYETSLTADENRFYYAFQITLGDDTVYYNRIGAVEREDMHIENAFVLLPGFFTPDWLKGAVIYQIFVDRFRKGNPDSDVLTGEYCYLKEPVVHVDDWNAPVEAMDVRRHYGGDLVGVMEKLDYLKWLGVEAIYFNPLFVSPSNHKYDIQDYDHIDPHFVGFKKDEGALLPKGSKENRESERYVTRVTDPENLEAANEYFATLTEEIHKRGMKVILDGVFNHCGSGNKWMDRERIYEGKPGYEKGAFIAEDSPYNSFFVFDGTDKWPYNKGYLSWWGHDTLPKLNYENSPQLHDYIMRIAKKWIREPYNIDGWRLDVAADLGQTSRYNHKFWHDFRNAVKEENPDAAIIAEHYGDPEQWLRGDQWDTIMNYDAFMEPVSYFLTGVEKHSDEYNAWLHGNGRMFFRVMAEKMSRLPVGSLQTAMNEISNHDHSRFLTRTNRQTGRIATAGSESASRGVSYATFREGVVMQFTLPGAPAVYYGDETGVMGWTDPDSRRTYPWGKESWDLITFHRDMIRIHQRYSCLKTGSYKPVADALGYVAYGRFDKQSAVLTLVNHSEKDRTVSIPVWTIGMSENGTVERIMQTNDAGYNIGVKKVEVKDGVLNVTLPAWSSTVYAEKLPYTGL